MMEVHLTDLENTAGEWELYWCLEIQTTRKRYWLTNNHNNC
jgi:hypothetical protein